MLCPGRRAREELEPGPGGPTLCVANIHVETSRLSSEAVSLGQALSFYMSDEFPGDANATSRLRLGYQRCLCYAPELWNQVHLNLSPGSRMTQLCEFGTRFVAFLSQIFLDRK